MTPRRQRHCALGEFACLRLGALTRRIEHHGVEAFEFASHVRAAEQVARDRLDRLETAGVLPPRA